MSLRINGQEKKLTVEPRVTLLDALRNHLDLTGAKKVCDRGTCGACTIIENGKPTYSCSVLAIEVADRKSTRLNSSHGYISYAVFCLKKKKNTPYCLSRVSSTQ